MTRGWSAEGAAAIAGELAERGVKAVRVLYPDLHGVARGKDVPIGSFAEVADDGMAFCSAVLTTDLRQTPVVDADETYGDLLARPDPETLRIVPWQPEVAWCVADLWSTDRAAPWPVCSRGSLSAVTARYRELGYTPLVGPELEFFLLEYDATSGRYRRYVDQVSRSYTVGYVSDPRGLVLEMLGACEQLGLQALSANHEFSNSQYEITVGHSSAVDAADRGFLLKTAVKEMAARAGLLATFMGKPFNDQGGSGFHVHLSLADGAGRNVFADDDSPDGLSPLVPAFVAGLLEHAQALMAVLAPTVNAYKRLAAKGLVPTHANWGHDNRTAFVRVPRDRGARTRIEIRAGDGAANSHLIVAALLAAGLDGVQRELEPPAPIHGGAISGDVGVPLPTNLEAALDRLESDELLVSALGDQLVDAFVRLKRFEVSRFNQWVSDWELDEYAHHL
jgi:glutamine synthetase